MNHHLDKFSLRLEELQEQICSIIEKCDGSGRFTKDSWHKNIGSGITRVISGGDKIEKGAINFSKVSGPLNKRMSQALKVQAKTFSATGISSVFHCKNPFVPGIHMNVRYFSFNNGIEWFGGGIDLTPAYINVDEAKFFHGRLKELCDKYRPEFYPEFKKCADDYFFLEHRDETRGIGGIFFDRQQPSKEFDFKMWMQFTAELSGLYPVLFTGLIEKNSQKPYTKENKAWQNIRRGRYVEFNLIYDRGTKFGLESGGNTESILISMPPDAKWEYQYSVEPGSNEEKTQQLLKKGIDWINN